MAAVVDRPGHLGSGYGRYLLAGRSGIDNLARGALILSVIGLVTIVAFWLGLPLLFAGAAGLLVLEGRRSGATSVAFPVAAVLAAVTTIAAAVLAFVG
jgi:hypothetical protein